MPSASQLLAFSPGKEQAAGVWETCLAPGRALGGEEAPTGLQKMGTRSPDPAPLCAHTPCTP